MILIWLWSEFAVCHSYYAHTVSAYVLSHSLKWVRLDQSIEDEGMAGFKFM
jgi:hypothetical protein